MLIELKHLRTLLALHQTGTLAGAAQRLHLTQSALSHQLKGLEDGLGLRLFSRKRRPLHLTPAGERLLQLAQRVLPECWATERELTRLAQGLAGRLHIAIECHSCFEWLMPAMDAFRTRWPDVVLDLSFAYSFDPLPALAQGDVDLVVTSDPLSLAGVVYHPLFRYQALLAVPKEHRLTQQTWIEPEDLRAETLITYPVSEARLDVFRRFLDPAGVTPGALRRCELTVMMLQLVASGRGVCALPSWALEEYLQRDYLAARPLGETGLWDVLHAAVRQGELNSEYMRDFLDIAATTCFEHLPGIEAVAPTE